MTRGVGLIAAAALVALALSGCEGNSGSTNARPATPFKLTAKLKMEDVQSRTYKVTITNLEPFSIDIAGLFVGYSPSGNTNERETSPHVQAAPKTEKLSRLDPKHSSTYTVTFPVLSEIEKDPTLNKSELHIHIWAQTVGEDAPVKAFHLQEGVTIQ